MHGENEPEGLSDQLANRLLRGRAGVFDPALSEEVAPGSKWVRVYALDDGRAVLAFMSNCGRRAPRINSGMVFSSAETVRNWSRLPGPDDEEVLWEMDGFMDRTDWKALIDEDREVMWVQLMSQAEASRQKPHSGEIL